MVNNFYTHIFQYHVIACHKHSTYEYTQLSSQSEQCIIKITVKST